MNIEGNFFLAGNGASSNRGCEAIFEGTIYILRQVFGDIPIVSAYVPDGNVIERNNDDRNILHVPIRPLKKYTFKWINYGVRKIIAPSKAPYYQFSHLKKYITKSKVVLMIGGDNYSLDYGSPMKYFFLNSYSYRFSKPVVLWGASVGPFSRDPVFEKLAVKELQKVSRIYARESATVEYLESVGIVDNVKLVADPAFLLPEEEIELPSNVEILLEYGCIGLNLSPLLAEFRIGSSMSDWIFNASKIVACLSDKLKIPILLIPHVTSNNNKVGTRDDYLFMSKVMDHLGSNKHEVHLLPPLTASQTKYVIGRCRIFAGSRTHSTIASISSLVPTVFIGYSMKARGICQDIFNHTDYLIENDQMNCECFPEKMEQLLHSEISVHNWLKRSIPIMQNRAMSAAYDLQSLLKQ
jgi:colanic acid/amylovoran biosynthesis protein